MVAGLDQMDIVVGVNIDKLSTIVGSMLQDKFAELLELQAESELDKKSAELQKKQIERLMDGMRTMVIGLRIEDDGIMLHMAGSVKEGSELSESVHMPVTANSLLNGLPKENWAMAIGQLADEKQMRNQNKSLDEMFEVYQATEGIDKEELGRLRKKVETLTLMYRGYRGAVVPLETADGVVGVHMIADFEDSNQALTLTKEIFELGKVLVGDVDEKIATIFEAVEFESDGDVSVLNVNLEKIEQIDEDQLEMIEAVIGPEVAIRMLKLDDKRVLMSFGGGQDRLQKLAKDSADPVISREKHAGLEPLSAFLPAERNSVTYIFVAQMIELGRAVLNALDEDDLPFPTPEVTVPVAVTATGGENWWSVDAVIPMEVIKAGRDIGMTMLGRR
jgi:hypothetical protein